MFPESVENFIFEEAKVAKLLDTVNHDFKVFITESSGREFLEKIQYSCDRFIELMMTKLADIHSFIADCAGTMIDLSDKLAETEHFDGYRDETVAKFRKLLDIMDQRCKPRDLYIIYIGGVAYISRVQEMRIRCLRGLIKALGAIGGSSRAKFLAASLPTVFSAFTAMLKQSLKSEAEQESEIIGKRISTEELLAIYEDLCVDNLAPSSFKLDTEKDPHTIGRYTVAALLTNILSTCLQLIPLPALPEVSRLTPADALASFKKTEGMEVLRQDPRTSPLATQQQKKIFSSLARIAQCVGFVHPLFKRQIETLSVLSASSNELMGDLEVTSFGIAVTIYFLTLSPAFCPPPLEKKKEEEVENGKETPSAVSAEQKKDEEKAEELIDFSPATCLNPLFNCSSIPMFWSSLKISIMRLKAVGVLLAQDDTPAFLKPALALLAASHKLLQVAISQFSSEFENVARLPCSPCRLLYQAAVGLATNASLTQSERVFGFDILSQLFDQTSNLEQIRLFTGAAQMANECDVACSALLDACRKPLLAILNAGVEKQITEAITFICKALFDDRQRIIDSVETLTSGISTLRICVSHSVQGDFCKNILKSVSLTPQPYSITFAAGGLEQMPLWLKESLKNAQGPMLDVLLAQKARLEREESRRERSKIRGTPTTGIKEIERLANEVSMEMEIKKNEGVSQQMGRFDLRLEILLTQLAALREHA